MIKFSLLLILIAVVLLGFTVAPALTPNNGTLLTLLAPVLCAPGENLIQQVSPLARNAGSDLNSFVANTALFCKTTSGTLTSVTDKLFGIGLTAFLVFLIFGVLFLIIGLIRNASRGNKPVVATTTTVASSFYSNQPTAAPASNPYATQVSAPRQPSYSNSYPTQVGFATPAASAPAAPSEKFDFDSAATMMSIPKAAPAPVQPAPAPAQPAPGNSDLAVRLTQLRDALDAGLISQEEFDRGKADLLRDWTDV